MKNPELYKVYREFMDKYVKLGHTKPATRGGEYFIPHNAVVKRNKQG